MAGPTECRPLRPGLAPGRMALLITAAGALAVCGLAALFAAILDNVLDGDGVTAWDGPISAWIMVHREPVLTTVMRSLTEVGNPPVLAAIMALAAAVTTLRVRTLAPAILGSVAVAGFALMVLTVKLAVGRPRPPVSERAIAIDGSSFPSGHATGIAVVALVSVWMLTRGRQGHRWTRAIAWIAAVVLIAAVGFSRVYLGVHYPSDIVAGWALGAAWAGILIAAGTAATPLWLGHPRGRRLCRP
ncbi:phosphatase PAP2 family protein [Nocardia aurantiaca]|uniref:Phosphatase PAP2 family protein n=1 Tax=Nocardia aurantiaca TaxID=2675850 RepID=A0A6I3L0L4_9NOCA|nr:phosphatase PAP2 family protein [Nocardia aurantiaca]MTE14320.1 phosphatase PAP2 family protein [Nocardia aurantiaca]